MDILNSRNLHSGNWIVASETKPGLNADTLYIVNASWRTGRGRAEIATHIAVQSDDLISLVVGYRYNGKYQGRAQYWQHYHHTGSGWRRVTWKALDDGERMSILDAWIGETIPGWVNCPGKLTRDYLKRGELRQLEMDEQGTIYGYKYLLYDLDGSLFRSPQRPDAIWHNGELTADHVPTEDNTHGIYAMKTRKNKTLYSFAGSDRRLVRLALSGTVVEANEGLRAEHAQIVEVLS